MMDRVAVFVDAGYLFAQGSQELWGATLRKLDFRRSSHTRTMMKDCGKSQSTTPVKCPLSTFPLWWIKFDPPISVRRR